MHATGGRVIEVNRCLLFIPYHEVLLWCQQLHGIAPVLGNS